MPSLEIQIVGIFEEQLLSIRLVSEGDLFNKIYQLNFFFQHFLVNHLISTKSQANYPMLENCTLCSIWITSVDKLVFSINLVVTFEFGLTDEFLAI